MTATTALDGPGAVHIERIVRECIAARTPAPTTAPNLQAMLTGWGRRVVRWGLHSRRPARRRDPRKTLPAWFHDDDLAA
jgi:hypothetical protein